MLLFKGCFTPKRIKMTILNLLMLDAWNHRKRLNGKFVSLNQKYVRLKLHKGDYIVKQNSL